MPTPLTPPALELVLQGLHESEIRCGIQNKPPAGGITAWIDYGSRTEKATFYGTYRWCPAGLAGRRSYRCLDARPRCASSLIAPMPKAAATDAVARRFCHALAEETAGMAPGSWRMVATIARRMGIPFEEASTIADDCARRAWQAVQVSRMFAA
jgi:hypothetical protein